MRLICASISLFTLKYQSIWLELSHFLAIETMNMIFNLNYLDTNDICHYTTHMPLLDVPQERFEGMGRFN